MYSPEEAAVVTANGWIKGISFSILASMIGAASKLSIRKSWLIDAKRKEHRLHKQQLLKSYDDMGRDREAYQEICSPANAYTSSMNLAPLEVGSPPPRNDNVPSHPQESFSSQEGETNEARSNKNNTSGGYFFNANNTTSDNLIRSSCLKISKPAFSPSTIAWLLYLSGMVGMSLLNPLCCVLAMQYANPSILAPFSGLTLVWVVLFSGAALGEYPGKSQKVACAFIVAGEVLVAMFGDHTNGEDRQVEDVLSSYQEPAFHTFLLLMTLFFIQLGIFIWVFPSDSPLRKVAWGSIGGSITGFQNFLKDALTIYDAISNSSQPQQSLPASFYLFVALAMTTAFVGLLCLAECMKRYDATYSAAMFVASFVVSASLMSCVHYHTFYHLEGINNYIMYPMGLITLFFGAYILIKPTAAAARLSWKDDNDDMSEEGQPTHLDLDYTASRREKERGCRQQLLTPGD